MVKIAIIGTGNMGRKYADMIYGGQAAGTQLTAMVCRSDEALAWGKGFKGVHICRSADELFENAALFDALLIATPHKTHPELTLRAFAHKKHVLCDKPAGILAADAVKMADAADECGLKYALMFHQRMRPEYNYLKNMITNGDFGTIHRMAYVSTRYFRTNAYHKSSPWRSTVEGEGGGALINQGQHPLDLWQWLFGLPDRLYALVRFGKYNDFDVEDEASLLMDYADGRTGSFIISTAEGIYEDRLIISGSKKAAELNGTQLKISSFSADTDEYRKTAACHAREQLETEITVPVLEKISDTGLYTGMLENFANAVMHDAPLIAPGRDGVGTLLLTNGAYLSQRLGKSIRLDEVAAAFNGL
ncbi:MAG: Gfo/Idh/MocA family oxidoreductase [Firmicutes bacterium]|nr:Gfo/Idh/MocA family oxidoreductase [Bacillota bacterium]